MQISSFFKQNLIYNNNCKEVKTGIYAAT